MPKFCPAGLLGHLFTGIGMFLCSHSHKILIEPKFRGKNPTNPNNKVTFCNHAGAQNKFIELFNWKCSKKIYFLPASNYRCSADIECEWDHQKNEQRENVAMKLHNCVIVFSHRNVVFMFGSCYQCMHQRHILNFVFFFRLIYLA